MDIDFENLSKPRNSKLRIKKTFSITKEAADIYVELQEKYETPRMCADIVEKLLLALKKHYSKSLAK